MGNPHLNPSVFDRFSHPAPPLTKVPPQFPELRICALCSLCEELVLEPTTADRHFARCSWQGDWWFPLKGCDRWQFDAALLGDEGCE